MPYYRNTDPNFGCTDSIYEAASKEALANEVNDMIVDYADAAQSGCAQSEATAYRDWNYYYQDTRYRFIKALEEVTDERA